MGDGGSRAGIQRGRWTAELPRQGRREGLGRKWKADRRIDETAPPLAFPRTSCMDMDVYPPRSHDVHGSGSGSDTFLPLREDVGKFLFVSCFLLFILVVAYQVSFPLSLSRGI